MAESRRVAMAVAAALLLVAAKPPTHSTPRTTPPPPAAAVKPAHPDSTVRPDTTARPDFSGVWKLSAERSVFGKIPGGQPSARTDSIRHDEPRIRQVLYLLNGTRRDTICGKSAVDSG